MKDGNSILGISLCVVGIASFVAFNLMLKVPFWKLSLTSNEHYSKINTKALPRFLKILMFIGVIMLIYGWVISRDIGLTLEFTGAGLVITALSLAPVLLVYNENTKTDASAD